MNGLSYFELGRPVFKVPLVTLCALFHKQGPFIEGVGH